MSRRMRLSYSNVVATVALVLAMSGGAIATTHWLITSTKQFSPRVLKKIEGLPAVAVHNDTGFSTTLPGDQDFHNIATLPISQAGNYVATAKVVATDTGGGVTNQAVVECGLVAHTNSGAADDSDQGYSYLATVGEEQMLALEVAHHFSGPGTITLHCEQNGTFSGGTTLRFDKAKVIATQASSLSNTAVTS
jgi:hypothetical protein